MWLPTFPTYVQMVITASEIGNHLMEGSNATQTHYLHQGQKDKNIKYRTRFVGPLVMDPTMNSLWYYISSSQWEE
jgi:hypothetical protein